MNKPAEILHFPDALFDSKKHEGVVAMTQRICNFYSKNVDDVFLDGVKKIALASGITTAIVFDETAMAEVLRLGMEAYQAKEAAQE